jgi:hypothetical protein
MSKFAESLQKEGKKLRAAEQDRDKYKGILNGIDDVINDLSEKKKYNN